MLPVLLRTELVLPPKDCVATELQTAARTPERLAFCIVHYCLVQLAQLGLFFRTSCSKRIRNSTTYGSSPSVGVENHQVNIYSFVVRCDRRWPNTQ